MSAVPQQGGGDWKLFDNILSNATTYQPPSLPLPLLQLSINVKNAATRCKITSKSFLTKKVKTDQSPAEKIDQT